VAKLRKKSYLCNMTAEELQKKDEQYMRKALAEAQQAFDEGEIPIGAVIVCKDHIIARAHNLTETLHDVTAHAEMQAITAAANELGGKYLTDCTLYVTVEPCSMCAGALGWSQITRVVYGTEDEKAGTSPQDDCHEGGIRRRMPPLNAGILQDQAVAFFFLQCSPKYIWQSVPSTLHH
jgi:Cytosine/adenosine deaminases